VDISAVSYILVPVRDLPAVRQWYREVLELPMGLNGDSAVEFCLGELTLAFYVCPDAVDAGETEGLYFAFEVDDLQEQYQVLKDRGVRFAGDVLQKGNRLVLDFFDPEGNRVGLTQTLYPAPPSAER